MNQKEFNELLNNITTLIIPINQLLYECLVLILLYNLFNSINFRNISLHKSFIILIAIIFICLDWFIWNNHIQTSLFTCILIIYITYNLNKSRSISNFIDFVNNSRDNYESNIKKNDDINKINNNNKLIKQKEQDEIYKITYIPKNFDARDSKNNNKSPKPFDKNIVGLNDYYVAYPSTNLPSTHITDSRYAETILNSLYETPQYMRQDLENPARKCNEQDLKNSNNKGARGTEALVTDIDLFRNPKKEFLDSRWLESKDYKYNDNCSGCMSKKPKTQNTQKVQNAICSVANFGYALEGCTNQEETINNIQLEKISSNNLKPIW
jgi:Ca2+/Na+ antiporter